MEAEPGGQVWAGPSYIGGIERGQRNPTLGVIHALASVLGVRMVDLVPGK